MLVANIFKTENLFFDLLRLFLACIVFGAHLIGLSNYEELNKYGYFFPSSLAVEMFFVLSGLFVSLSYERSFNYKDYITKRLRRMAPSYIFTIFICSMIWALIPEISIGYFISNIYEWIKYVFFNILTLNFMAPTYFHIFDENHVQAINGALWTIKIEVMFYILVPFFALLYKKLEPYVLTFFIATFSLIYGLVTNSLDLFGYGDIISRQLPGQLVYFAVGMYLFYEKDFTPLKALITSIIFLVAVLLEYKVVVHSIAFGVVCVLLSKASMNIKIRKKRYVDFSYSLYLIHFPIIQFLLSINLLQDHPYLFTSFIIAIVTMFSIICAIFIEKPFLKKRPGLVNA